MRDPGDVGGVVVSAAVTVICSVAGWNVKAAPAGLVIVVLLMAIVSAAG